jgi:hypothetical protein
LTKAPRWRTFLVNVNNTYALAGTTKNESFLLSTDGFHINIKACRLQEFVPMETLKTQVDIPENRRVVIDMHIPANIPTGKMDVVLVFQKRTEISVRPQRILGAYKEKIRIAADFDKHLGDEFWLGENDELPA